MSDKGSACGTIDFSTFGNAPPCKFMCVNHDAFRETSDIRKSRHGRFGIGEPLAVSRGQS
jgi:hypothetical protein